MEVEHYQQILQDGAIGIGTLYVHDEKSVENCIIVLSGFYNIRRLSPKEVPGDFEGMIGLRISKLEKK